MTTRLNNIMIMVHLIRSLLTNLNSMIAIEAKYVELCKYTVAYVGLNFLQRSSAVAEGPCNACRSDLSVLETRGLTFPLYSTMGSYWSNWCVRKGRGVAPFARKFRMERVSPYQPFLAWWVSGLSSAVEPPDAPMEAPLPCQ